jgi:hypothetical protein
MTAIDRREILRVMLGGAAVAAAGLALMPVPAKSAPLERVPKSQNRYGIPESAEL